MFTFTLFSEQQGKQQAQFVSVLTFLMKPGRQLLSLLEVWAWKHLQHLFDATPPGPSQDLGQAYAQWGIAAVHIGDVVGVLQDQKTHS